MRTGDVIVGRAEDIFEKIKKAGEQAIDEFIIDRIHSVLYNCACLIKNIVAIAPCIKNFFYRESQFLQS